MDKFLIKRGAAASAPVPKRPRPDEETATPLPPPTTWEWSEVANGAVLRLAPADGSLVLRPKQDLIAFDLDGCLIVPASGKRFPSATDATDWRFRTGAVPRAVRRAAASGARIAILSNQLGVDTGRTDKAVLQQRVQAVACALSVPLEALFAVRDDCHRKPRTGMWELLAASPAVSGHMFVGDAAGRPKLPPATDRADFAASDREFAINVGAEFKTPEAYFDKSCAPVHLCSPKVAMKLGFDPRKLRHSGGDGPWRPPWWGGDGGGACDQELVILCGLPASGKSRLARDVFEATAGFARVNQDTLKTIEQCEAAARDALVRGQSVVVDNTNLTRELRARWTKLARTCDDRGGGAVRVACVVVATPRETARHLAALRRLYPPTAEDANHSVVPDVAVRQLAAKFEPPASDEPFDVLCEKPFVPGPFETAEQECRFFQFLGA